MNPSQLAQQVKYLLQTVVWPTGAGEVVFGARGVIVYAGRITDDQMPRAFPAALVGIDSGTPDPDHPELIMQSLNVSVAVEVAGDPMGEHAVIGGSAANLGRSAGRGIGEVGERARAAVANLVGVDGAPLVITATALNTPATIGPGRHLVADEMTLTGLCTSELHYAAPQQLRHLGLTWAWAGDHCSSRFDFVRFRLVQKFGVVPSEDPDDGTTVYTGTDAFFVGSQLSGYTYTVFADYSARGGETIEGSSTAEVGSYR